MKQAQAPNQENLTRQKLIEAGTKLFGLHGFEATSTRALASQAGSNLSAIPYHFGGKLGLYRAVAERAVAAKYEEIGYKYDQVLAACSDPAINGKDLYEIMRQMVASTVEAMLGNQESRDFSQILMQEQISPTAAFDIFYDGFVKKALAAWSAWLGRLTGLAPESDELKLRTFSVLGQLIIFRVGMTANLRQLGCDRLSKEHLEIIAKLVINQIEAMVAGFAPVSRGVAA